MAQRRGKESDDDVRDLVDLDRGEDGPQGAIPELVRKAISAGFSGFFFTEEVIRKALGDTLPKEWAEFAQEQSDRARADFNDRLSREIGRALQNLDYAEVLGQLLEGRTLEVNAKIRLSGKEAAAASGPGKRTKRGDDDR